MMLCKTAPNDYESTTIEMELALDASRWPIGTSQTIGRELSEHVTAAYSVLSRFNEIRGCRRLLGPSNELSLLADYRLCDDTTTRTMSAILAGGIGFGRTVPSVFCLPEYKPITRDVLSSLANAPNIWVAEKSTGVRVALVFSREYGICLLASNGDAFHLNGCIPELCTFGPTAFECELATNVHSCRKTLIIVRLVMDNGTPQARVDFGVAYSRMCFLVDNLVAPNFNRSSEYPFDLHTKKFVSLSEYGLFTDRMTRDPPNRNIVYTARARYVIDAIMLVVVTQDTWLYYCWQPSHRSTIIAIPLIDVSTRMIDLCISTESGCMSKFASIQLSEPEWHQILCARMDTLIVARVNSSRHKPAPILLEVSYNETNGQWSMVTVCTNNELPATLAGLTKMLTSKISPITYNEFERTVKK